MLRKTATVIAILTLVAIAYLTLAPVPVEPVAWQAPPAPGYTGPHARNTRLANLQHLIIGSEEGPEGMASGPDGKLYAAVASGAIVRLNPDGSGFEKWADTRGRVLGINFDAHQPDATARGVDSLRIHQVRIAGRPAHRRRALRRCVS